MKKFFVLTLALLFYTGSNLCFHCGLHLKGEKADPCQHSPSPHKKGTDNTCKCIKSALKILPKESLKLLVFKKGSESLEKKSYPPFSPKVWKLPSLLYLETGRPFYNPEISSALSANSRLAMFGRFLT